MYIKFAKVVCFCTLRETRGRNNCGRKEGRARKKSKGKKYERKKNEKRRKREAANIHIHPRRSLGYKLLRKRLGLWHVGNRTPGGSLFVFACCCPSTVHSGKKNQKENTHPPCIQLWACLRCIYTVQCVT